MSDQVESPWVTGRFRDGAALQGFLAFVAVAMAGDYRAGRLGVDFGRRSVQVDADADGARLETR
ncbi:MAG: hypothetical protein R3C97_11335 [Geminicoccaceae bacterium]